jgi:hypothetical protein
VKNRQFFACCGRAAYVKRIPMQKCIPWEPEKLSNSEPEGEGKGELGTWEPVKKGLQYEQGMLRNGHREDGSYHVDLDNI